MYRLFLTMLLFVMFLLVPTSTYAQDCTIIYGGGKTECKQDAIVTPAPSMPTNTPAPANQTKGGLPIHPTTAAKTTPATGPEVFSLLALLPMGAAGIWLRRKTN